MFDAEDCIGGRTNTIEATMNGRRQALDTGFIISTRETCPNFIEQMHRLVVPCETCDMVLHLSSLQMRTGGHSLGKRVH